MKHFGLTILIAASLGACSAPTTQTTQAPSAPTTATPSSGPAVAAQAAVAGAAAGPVDRLVNDEMLGVTVAFFDQAAGIPREINGDDRVYQVGGCRIAVHVAAGQVRTIQAPIGADCDPLVNGRRLRGVTIGAASEPIGVGTWTSDCLISCGNAADPEHYFQSSGSRATGGHVVRLASTGLEAGFFDRQSALVRRMTSAHDEAYVVDGRWRCRSEWQADLRQLISSSPITSVTIGFEDNLPLECRT